jgi:hypothetical protein
VLAACGGGDGDNNPQDALLDVPVPCSDQPGTRFVMERATTFGTLPAGAFPGEVCIEGRSDIPCVMPLMQAGGQFLMCVPATGGFGLELVSAGHERTVVLHGEGTTGTAFNAPDNTFAMNEIWEPAAAATYPPTDKGFLTIGFFINREPSFPGRIPGGTATFDPPLGKPILYLNDNGRTDPALTETGEAGLAVVADVDPGMYDITLAGVTNCQIVTGAGWESPVVAAQARIPVIAGKTVFAGFYCDDPGI